MATYLTRRADPRPRTSRSRRFFSPLHDSARSSIALHARRQAFDAANASTLAQYASLSEPITSSEQEEKRRRKERGNIIGKLLRQNSGLIHRIALRMHYICNPRNATVEDLEQEGRMALARAIQFFDPQRGSFSAFAATAIQNGISGAIKSMERRERVPLGDSEEDKSDADLTNCINRMLLRTLLRVLSPLEMSFVFERYKNDMPLAKIGEVIGIRLTLKQAWLMEKRILEKLRCHVVESSSTSPP